MKFLLILTIAISFQFSTGCATILKGYDSEVELYNVDDSSSFALFDGIPIDIPSTPKEMTRYSVSTGREIPILQRDSTVQVLKLRSKNDHVIVVNKNGKQVPFFVYPKLDPWWFIADILCLGTPALIGKGAVIVKAIAYAAATLPMTIDALTGNWNYFDDINTNFTKSDENRN